jgi:hypothetical protein
MHQIHGACAKVSRLSAGSGSGPTPLPKATWESALLPIFQHLSVLRMPTRQSLARGGPAPRPIPLGVPDHLFPHLVAALVSLCPGSRLHWAPARNNCRRCPRAPSLHTVLWVPYRPSGQNMGDFGHHQVRTTSLPCPSPAASRGAPPTNRCRHPPWCLPSSCSRADAPFR